MIRKLLFFIVIAVLLLSTMTAVSWAGDCETCGWRTNSTQADDPTPGEPGEIETGLLDYVLSLGGIGALVGLIVDQLIKRVFPSMDGKARMVIAGFNLLLMIAMLVFDFLGLGVNWTTIDTFAAGIYELAMILLGLIGMQGGAIFLHESGRGTFLSNSIS